MDKWDEISAHQLFNYDDGLRELVLWLGYSDVRSSTQQMHVAMVKSAFAHAFFQGAHRSSTQQMHVAMVKSAFAHAFFQGAHRDDGKMNVTSEKFYARKDMGTVQNLPRKQMLSNCSTSSHQ